MTIIKQRNSLLNQLPSFFDAFLSNEALNWGQSNYSDTNTTIPAINIKETGNHYEVELAAPGMHKNDFKIQLDGNVLTITSEKSLTREESKEVRYTLREFSYQSFQRRFNLQKDVVDADRIEAKYQDGVLQLIIPKKEAAKQMEPRLIEVA